MIQIKRYALLALLAIPTTLWAHEPHICPPGVNDVPGLQGGQHTEQDFLRTGTLESSQIFLRGGAWGESRFNECDGQGRPATTGGGEKRAADQPSMTRLSGPEGTSCAGCHAQPRPGGAGDFVANTFNGAELMDPIIQSISPRFSNERNTTGMFGAGYLELAAKEMTRDLQRQAKLLRWHDGWHTLTTKGIDFDVRIQGDQVVEARGIDTDLIVKPFGAGGTKVSIREFTVGAFNRHHGIQAEEAYDLYLGDPDYDEDGITREITIGDMTVTSLWQAMLDRPVQELPDEEQELDVVEHGAQVFASVGCASCHTPEIVLNDRTFCEPNEYNPPGIFNDTSQSVCLLLNYEANDSTKTDSTSNASFGTKPAKTPLTLTPYTDLKRHHMCDPEGPGAIRDLCNEQVAEGRPDQDGFPGYEFFMTADLWQLGESAPWGHRGNYNSVSSVILAHAGEARTSRDDFASLTPSDQVAVVKFLLTLKIRDQPIRVNDG